MGNPPSDHDLLIRIDERVERIDIRIDDHSKRIRTCERFKAWVLGGFGAFTALLGWIKYGGH